MQNENICSFIGCDRVADGASFLCKSHYAQKWRGKELTPIRGRVCLKEGDIEKIIRILQETELNCAEIGSIFGVSRGPISDIQKKYRVERKTTYNSNTFYKLCSWCNKLFKARIIDKRLNRFKYCSKKCYTKWQKSSANHGENNPKWKGGSETVLNKLRKGDEWKTWRFLVFERDNYTCQLCGVKGGRLIPHHIIKKSIDQARIFDLLDGITLCNKCHMGKGIHTNNGAYQLYFSRLVNETVMHPYCFKDC